MPLLGSLAAGSVKGFGAQANLGYFLGQSLRFRSSASARLTRTFASTGTNNKIQTFSAWVKRGNLSSAGTYRLMGGYDGSSTNSTEINFVNDQLRIEFGGSASNSLITTAKYRDPSAWYHIVVAIDTTQATNSNRIKMYVNGSQITAFDTANYPAQNAVSQLTSANANNSVGAGWSGFDYFDGYMGDVYFVDGQALTPSDFGKTDPSTGSWIPKKYSGTYGTNGFKLDFKHQIFASGFNAVAYTGNGTSQSITGVGFSPDLVWGKNRGATASHNLLDTVRGATKRLFSNSDEAEVTTATSLTSFDSDGFTLGSDTGLNTNTNTYVAWCWDAGSSTVSNTDGDITASVRANPATGFSIVTWDAPSSGSTTVGHGLSSAPELVICKIRNVTSNWQTWHTGLSGGTYTLFLNSTGAEQVQADAFGAVPTSSVLNIGSDFSGSGRQNIAYCFHSVSGFSKFGSYTGNGTSQSINLGFRPAFVMWKRIDGGTNSWIIKDNTRYADNQGNLFPNQDLAENTDTNVTFTDTGFDVDSALGYNGSGREFIYMAFADTRDTAFWRDKSGTDNHWSLNAINYAASAETTYDLMNDVPTLTSADKGNFATLNPLDSSTTTVPTTSNANLRIVGTVSDYQGMYMSMAIPSTGKWYFEYTYETKQGLGGNQQTLISPSPTMSGSGAIAGSTTLYGLYSNSNYYYGSTGQTDLGIAAVAGNTQMVAYDSDTGKLWWGYNGTWFLSGNPSAGTNPLATQTASIEKYIANVTYGTGGTTVYNFGQQPFKYTPPTGYKKLNTYNL